MSSPSVSQAFERLRAAYQAERYPSYERRRRWLDGLIAALLDAADATASACDQDFGGRARQDSLLGEVWVTINDLKSIRKQLKRWMKPEARPVPLHFKMGSASVQAQPKGVVAILAPWNYPVMLALQPLAAALAAGNRVILKLSEHTPATARLVEELVRRAVPEDVVQVFSGGVEEGEAIGSLPLDHLLFTGSNRVGRLIYEQAAKNMVPVTLELGGKTPAILHSSYSVGHFADRVLQGKCYSGGQSCVAPDYLLVPSAMQGAVVSALREMFVARFPSVVNNPDYTAVASDAQLERLTALLQDAKERGATVTELNPQQEDVSGTRKLPLTLLTEVPEDAQVMHEEVFGPLLPIVGYGSLEEAIKYVNQRPRPLALYYFDEDSERAERVLHQTTSGGATINDTLIHFICDSLPRAAVGASGMGAYQGRAGFELFSHQKSVFVQSNVNGLSLLAPPYTGRSDQIIKWLLRR